MQTRQWSELYRLVGEVSREHPRGSRRFADRVIVLVLLWAAFNHKPVFWACQRRNWPVWMQRLLPSVPSPTTMSRRSRRKSVWLFMRCVLERAQADLPRSLVAVVDGTALEIRSHSTDPHAGYGHSAGRGRSAKGYKLHVLLDLSEKLLDWRVAPMNTPESTMAGRMILKTEQLVYVVGDAGYDRNWLHHMVQARGGQLVAPRSKPCTTLGHRRHARGRLRSVLLTEGPSPFGRALLSARKSVERFFAHADASAEGLGELPSWVRTAPRVQRWVLAKLIINAVRVRCLRLAA